MTLPTIPVVLPTSAIRRFELRPPPDPTSNVYPNCLQSTRSSLVLPCATQTALSVYCQNESIVTYGYMISFPQLPAFTLGSAFMLQLIPPEAGPQPPPSTSTIEVEVAPGWDEQDMRDGIVEAINTWARTLAKAWRNYDGMYAVPYLSEGTYGVEFFMPFGPVNVTVVQAGFAAMTMTQNRYGSEVPLFLGQYGPGNKAIIAPLWQPLVYRNYVGEGYTGPLPHEFQHT